jgi:hypothetical protein
MRYFNQNVDDHKATAKVVAVAIGPTWSLSLSNRAQDRTGIGSPTKGSIDSAFRLARRGESETPRQPCRQRGVPRLAARSKGLTRDLSNHRHSVIDRDDLDQGYLELGHPPIDMAAIATSREVHAR